MKFDLLEGGYKEPVPVVQQKKKYANFTIREIGGPAEIIEWRRQQAAKEALYQARVDNRDRAISAFMKENGPMDSPKVTTLDWQDKLKFAMSERERLRKVEDAPHKPYVFPKEPKIPFMAKIKKWIKKFWNDANFT